MTRLDGVPVAFGASGAFWLVAGQAFVPYAPASLLVLAAGFVVAAVGALATWGDHQLAALAGLWVLAIVCNSAWISMAGVSGTVFEVLFYGGVWGTGAFGAWMFVGIAVLLLLPQSSSTPQA